MKRYAHPPLSDRTFPLWTRRGRLPRDSLARAIHPTSPRRRESAFRFAHPPPPETQVVNNGFDAMWESRNKGKLFKDMTIPEPEE